MVRLCFLPPQIHQLPPAFYGHNIKSGCLFSSRSAKGSLGYITTADLNSGGTHPTDGKCSAMVLATREK